MTAQAPPGERAHALRWRPRGPRSGWSFSGPPWAGLPRPVRPVRLYGGRHLVSYALPVLTAAVAVALWFRPHRFVASGDVAPFVRENLGAELTSLWNHQVSGGGSTGYAIIQALDVLLLRLTGSVGLPPFVAQYLLYAGCFGFAAFGGAFLAGVWTHRPAARAVAGLAAAFNIYLLVNRPNVLPALAIGVTGTLAGLVLRAASGRVIRARTLVLLTLPASYLAQNPPLLVVSAAAVALSVVAADLLVGPGGTWRALVLSVRAVPGAVLVNLWWIAPYVLTLVHGEGLTLTAQRDVGAWAWTQVRSSLPNVAALNAHWSWAFSEYYPFRAPMEQWPWRLLRWALPAMALAGVALADRRRRRAAVTLAVACLPLIWLGKGTHPPLAWTNAWLFDHVPGFWLLREPANKLTMLLVLVYGSLAAIAVDRLLAIAGERARGPRSAAARVAVRAGVRAGVAVAAGAALAYPWPLWTGAVTAGQKDLAAQGDVTARVRIPDAWYRLAAAVNAAKEPGKALVLPLNTYYQVTTDWGYHGADTVPTQLIRRPVLQPLPGGYFGSPVDDVLATLETALVDGAERDVVARLFRSLGVSQVIVRHDLRNDPGQRPASDTGTISTALRQAGLVRSVRRFGVADLYRLTNDVVRADRGLVTTDGITATDGLPLDVAVTDPAHAGDEAPTRRLRTTGDSTRFRLASAGRYRIALGSVPRPPVRVESRREGDRTWLVVRDAHRYAVDGHPVPGSAPVRVPYPRGAESAVLDLGGVPREVPAGGALITGRVGPTVPVRFGRDAVRGEFGRVGGCGARGGGQGSYPEAHRDPVAVRTAPRSVRLSAVVRSACTSIPVRPGASVYRVRFDHRSPTGDAARICLWQEGPDRCARAAAPSNGGRDWARYDEWVRVDPGTRGLRLDVHADGPGDRAASVEYRHVGVEAVRAVRTVRTARLPRAGHVTVSLGAGWHRIARTPPATRSPLVSRGSFQGCEYEPGFEPTGAGVGVRRTPGSGLELTAGEEMICVAAPVRGSVSDAYRLTLDYRTVAGLPARICVWQVGPDSCAKLPTLATGRRWRTLSTVFRPHPRTRALRFYLYADGQANPRTVTEYRRVSLSRVEPVTIALEPKEEMPPAPRLTVRTRDPGRHLVDVSGARGTFVLSLAESFARGWRLEGLPRGWRARHLPVDGYANGWVVSGRGDAGLELVYAPARWIAPALPISALTAVIVIASFVVPRMMPDISRRCSVRRRRIRVPRPREGSADISR